MRTKASRKRSAFVRSVRAEGALTAYATALAWLLRYPASEVETRLREKVQSCGHEVYAAKAARAVLNDEASGQATGSAL